jgi:CRISPR-associated protein Cas5t
MVTTTGTPRTVLKVTVEAAVVSFRYPHFLIGRQPTFDMPPPSTIYGHVASALGEWPERPLRFAYVFQSRCRAADLEHQHVINATSGKFPGEIVDPLWTAPEPVGKKKPTKKELTPRLLEKTTEAVVQPHVRDFLFDVRLELYLDDLSLEAAFRSPVFTVVLGRSQDLATIRSVERVELTPGRKGYLDNTLLPAGLRTRLPWGVTTLMPSYIGPAPEREAVFAPYIVLRDRVYVGETEGLGSRRVLEIEGEEPPEWYADPTGPVEKDRPRLLLFQTIVPGKGTL